MEKTCLVSVVAPVYNGEDFLREFVDSVIAQTLRDWELICVDDGSTDKSAAILDGYAEKDPRVRVIRAEHSNAGTARNLGLEQVRGKYVCFLDSDDILKPQMLESLVAHAEKTDADLTVCDTVSYSMKTKEEAPMGWSIRWHMLPPLKDGVFSRDDATDRLFQLFVISPWNKMWKRELLEKNSIRAQSQIAANDVQLTMSALACAERICPVKQALYIQRRDNPGSITGNLGSTAKHLCGYTSALGLKGELERLGLYEKLKVSFQILAVHNTMWYLEQQIDHEEIFRADYTFLKEEGFRTLGIDLLLPGALSGCTKADLGTYKLVCQTTPYGFILNRYRKKEEQLEQKMTELQLIRMNRAHKAADLIVRGRTALRLKPRAAAAARVSAKDKRDDRAAKKNAEKRICILAFEDYHYIVVENMIRICNPMKNYVEVRINGAGYSDIVKQLEPELRDRVHWKRSDDVSLKGVRPTEKNYLYQHRQEGLIADAAAQKDLDMIIIPSPEFHPDWYAPVWKNRDRRVQVILGVHNLNDALLSPDAPKDVREMYLAADGYAVIDRSLKDRMEEEGITKPILIFPQIYTPREQKKREGDRVRLVVTGSVDPSRKDYGMLADAFERLPDAWGRLSLEFTGKAAGAYADGIVERFRKMEEGGLEFVSHKEFVPIEQFSRSMDRADFIVAPIVTETAVRGIRETYGQTKISGLQLDMIKYARPAMAIAGMRIGEELQDSLMTFRDADELAERIRETLKDGFPEEMRERALRNSEKFLPEKLIW